MPRITPQVPDETSLLCEHCGYILDSLPEGTVCPECGTPVSESSDPELRRVPAWEQSRGAAGRIGSFVQTSAQVIFSPSYFFRHFTTRARGNAAPAFALIHAAIASILLGIAAQIHVTWYANMGLSGSAGADRGTLLFAAGIFICLILTTRIASRLTAWEAKYRGLRLPRAVVLRGLYYHTAHYLPVAVFAFATVGGYRMMLMHGMADGTTSTIYLYVLCGEVVAFAVYLFIAYWIGMRNMMYASR